MHPSDDIKREEYYRALINILDDFKMEKEKTLELQKATMNILEDIEAEHQKIEFSRKLLEAANKELEAFSYSVSHDLQAPLRAILGFSQALIEDCGPQINAEGNRYLKLIKDNAQFMAQLIHDLLAFSRLGRQKIDVDYIDMRGLARSTYESLMQLDPTRNVEFKLGPLPVVWSDPLMIRQVFVNLISNALKFTKYRAQAVIEIGASEDKNEYTFYVKDNGAGFDMKFVDKLFGVFQRLHTSEEFEGTGIGLALVKRIIVRNGGRVWAEGAVDQGACFYFTLPRS